MEQVFCISQINRNFATVFWQGQNEISPIDNKLTKSKKKMKKMMIALVAALCMMGTTQAMAQDVKKAAPAQTSCKQTDKKCDKAKNCCKANSTNCCKKSDAACCKEGKGQNCCKKDSVNCCKKAAAQNCCKKAAAKK